MSVYHHLEIAPVSNTVITLSAVRSFISTLASKGLIEEEFAIFTGDEKAVLGIDIWDFRNSTVASELTTSSKLEVVKENDFEKLSDVKNYAFKIHLKGTSDLFKKLEIFGYNERQHYPLFISFLCNPSDITIIKEDESENKEKITISHVNCFIHTSGRNINTLYGLLENQDEFAAFFDEVRNFIGDFESGTWYD
jgi:hypothetical protein